jgi:hypothetical protein
MKLRFYAQWGFTVFNALIDMKPEPGAVYIHSASEPYTEEQEISQEINSWMDYFRINKYQCHCSWHARSKDLFQIAEEINPCRLYLIHTTHPEIYRKKFKYVLDITEGQSYSLAWNIQCNEWNGLISKEDRCNYYHTRFSYELNTP